MDITIPEIELIFFENLAGKHGFVFTKEENNLSYGGKYKTYKKGEKNERVAIDLLINGVQSRQTNFFYPFNTIYENSINREVIGYGSDERCLVRVANKEMLIALKMNSMIDRYQDMRDVIALCYEKPNAKKIINLLSKCPKNIIIKGINRLMDLLESEEQKDAIKGTFSINNKIYSKIIKNTKTILEEINFRLK